MAVPLAHLAPRLKPLLFGAFGHNPVDRVLVLWQVQPTVINGQLTIVPEPETRALIGSLSQLAWDLVRRKGAFL